MGILTLLGPFDPYYDLSVNKDITKKQIYKKADSYPDAG